MEYLLRTPRSVSIEELITERNRDLHVPSLCDVEVCSALRRALLQNRLSIGRAEEALDDYLDLPLTRHDHQPLMEQILRLRNNFSAYDATYIALAKQLKASFATCDLALARSVRHFFPTWDIAT